MNTFILYKLRNAFQVLVYVALLSQILLEVEASSKIMSLFGILKL